MADTTRKSDSSSRLGGLGRAGAAVGRVRFGPRRQPVRSRLAAGVEAEELGKRARRVMDSITEITVVGGDRHRVDGNVKEVEQLILSAARGSIMQFAWFTDAENSVPVGINPEHVMTLRSIGQTGQSADGL